MGLLDSFLTGAQEAIDTWKKGKPKPEDIPKGSKNVENILKDKK